MRVNSCVCASDRAHVGRCRNKVLQGSTPTIQGVLQPRTQEPTSELSRSASVSATQSASYEDIGTSLCKGDAIGTISTENSAASVLKDLTEY